MSLSDLLPPIPRPPHDPESWLLNGRVGWQEAVLQNVVRLPGDRSLALAPAPGTVPPLTDSGGSFGGLTLPANVALGPDGSIYLLDPASLQLKRFDPCECRFDLVPCFGGEGGGPRQLRNPHGIALCAGNLFVCDTGLSGSTVTDPCDTPELKQRRDERVRRENHRVSVFSLHGFLTRGHWAPPASAYQGPQPALANLWEPWDIAFDGRGHAYVTDPANGCIHRFSPRGAWLGCLPGFGRVTWIAVDCQDRIYVVVEGAPSIVRVIDAEGRDLGAPGSAADLAPLFPRLPFTVDAAGNLHLGALCVPRPEDACVDPRKPAPERGVFDLHGNPIANPAQPSSALYQKAGSYISRALDSETYRCQWHRVVLTGALPDGARVTVLTYTSEALLEDGQVQALPDEAWETRQTAHALEQGQWDCLVRSGGGRYLWLRLELAGSGKVTPRVESVKLEFPRISLRRYLPAVFGAEPTSADFTDRFLSLFDTTLRSVEGEVDHLARYFDPLSAPATRAASGSLDFLTWLGTWIGVALDRHWPEARRRAFLKNAGKIYSLRGTREGLRRQLLLVLNLDPERCCCPGDQPKRRCCPPPLNCAPEEKRPCAWQPPPLILEHYQLRRWMFLGAGRLGDQAMLWGQRIVNRSQLGEGAQVGHSQLITTQDPYRDPFHVYAHKFTVFVPAACGSTDQGRKGLENLLKAESPAHTAYQIRYVEPRFRIGFQSTIGLDAVIGRLPEGGVRLDGGTPLGQDSVLTRPPQAQGGPSLQVGESRLGTTSRLD
ncbi:MAG TPA: phage tail protein [Armatimonadota bacterium]|jgi:phage tail-like protein